MSDVVKHCGGAIAAAVAGFESPDRRSTFQCLAILAASFPGRMPEETAKAWARKIQGMNASADDVRRACETIAATDERPVLSRLVSAIRARSTNRRSTRGDSPAEQRFRQRAGDGGAWACVHASAPGEVCGQCGGE